MYQPIIKKYKSVTYAIKISKKVDGFYKTDLIRFETLINASFNNVAYFHSFIGTGQFSDQ